MRLPKMKFGLPRMSLAIAVVGGFLFTACSEMESQPVSTDQTNLEAGGDIDALMAQNPNLIYLEAEATESLGSDDLSDANLRGAPSSKARFDIELRFIQEPTPRQREVFEAAVERWEKIIKKDELNLTGVEIPSSFSPEPLVAEDQVLDDIIIEVNLTEIDGPSGILGRAGPRFIRIPQNTTLTGLMEFDVADLAGLEADNLFEEVILHEMGHVLGIGTLWQAKELITLNSIEQIFNPDYFGRFGNLFWKTEGGDGLLPVEGVFFDPDGNPFIRPGTSFGHWDEDRLDNELMTGFLNLGANPLSRITAGSVRDLGYGTATVGEKYELPTQPNPAARTSANGINIAEGEELYLPIGVVVTTNR